jgi:hypothetical protein
MCERICCHHVTSGALSDICRAVDSSVALHTHCSSECRIVCGRELDLSVGCAKQLIDSHNNSQCARHCHSARTDCDECMHTVDAECCMNQPVEFTLDMPTVALTTCADTETNSQHCTAVGANTLATVIRGAEFGVCEPQQCCRARINRTPSPTAQHEYCSLQRTRKAVERQRRQHSHPAMQRPPSPTSAGNRRCCCPVHRCRRARARRRYDPFALLSMRLYTASKSCLASHSGN